MNLDFSDYPELEGPIVLLIGCLPSETEDLRDKLYDNLLIEANAQTVEFIHVRLDTYWWDDPTLYDNLHRLLDLFPRKSKQTALKWIETDGFVKEVRKLLTQRVEKATSLETLPANWPELVSLAILDVDAETSYVQRVFDGWFPNAQFRANQGRGKTIAIWRDAEVTPIQQVGKPAPGVVLGWLLERVPGFPAPVVRKLEDVRTGFTIEMLVRFDRDGLKTFIFTDEQIDAVEAVVQALGLWLGMTEEQIKQVRRGLVPTTPISDLGRTASFGLGLTHPWGRDAD